MYVLGATVELGREGFGFIFLRFIFIEWIKSELMEATRKKKKDRPLQKQNFSFNQNSQRAWSLRRSGVYADTAWGAWRFYRMERRDRRGWKICQKSEVVDTTL